MMIVFFLVPDGRSAMTEMFRRFQQKKNDGRTDGICVTAGIFSYGNRRGQNQSR